MKIRNPKLEPRNKFENVELLKLNSWFNYSPRGGARPTKTKNSEGKVVGRAPPRGEIGMFQQAAKAISYNCFGLFAISPFGFISEFEFRASSF